MKLGVGGTGMLLDVVCCGTDILPVPFFTSFYFGLGTRAKILLNEKV